MTVPAFSLSSVLPGASPTPTGAGAAATGMAAGLFDSLLAGLAAPDPAAPKSGRGEAARDPLDADPTAQDAATASQEAGLALLLVAPGVAPVPALQAPAASDGETAVQTATRQIRIPGFGVDPAAILPAMTGENADSQAVAAGSPQEPVVAAPGASVPPSAIASRLGERTEASPVAAEPAPATFPPATPAKPATLAQAPAAAAPSVAVQQAAALRTAARQAIVQQAVVPQVVAQQVVAPAAAAAPAEGPEAGAVAAVEVAAVEVVTTPAPARAAASEGEPRRSGPARGDRRLDNAGRPTTPADASPVKQAALAALADDAAPDAADSGVSAGSDTAEAVDASAAPDTRQPALPGDVRVQTAQAAQAAETAAAPRGSPETVARLAADIVRKLEGQSTRFDLELNPHGMGKVDVAIEIDRDGKLTAAMSFDSAQSAADLRGRAGELRLALEQAGFDVSDGGLTFDLASQASGAGGREAGQQQQDRAWTGRAFQRAQSGVEEADLSLATPSTSARWTRSGVDIRI